MDLRTVVRFIKSLSLYFVNVDPFKKVSTNGSVNLPSHRFSSQKPTRELVLSENRFANLPVNTSQLAGSELWSLFFGDKVVKKISLEI